MNSNERAVGTAASDKQTDKQVEIIPAILEAEEHILNWAWASKTYHAYIHLFQKQAHPNTVEQQNRCFYNSHFF